MVEKTDVVIIIIVCIAFTLHSLILGHYAVNFGKELAKYDAHKLYKDQLDEMETNRDKYWWKAIELRELKKDLCNKGVNAFCDQGTTTVKIWACNENETVTECQDFYGAQICVSHTCSSGSHMNPEVYIYEKEEK